MKAKILVELLNILQDDELSFDFYLPNEDFVISGAATARNRKGYNWCSRVNEQDEIWLEKHYCTENPKKPGEWTILAEHFALE